MLDRNVYDRRDEQRRMTETIPSRIAKRTRYNRCRQPHYLNAFKRTQKHQPFQRGERL